MYQALGIVNFAGNHIRVDGLQNYRPVEAFSFLGRYRLIDFPISNLSNSGIDSIQVYVRTKPRSLIEHLGTGRHYNINSKKGKLSILFAEDDMKGNDIYNTDIAAFKENLTYIERAHQPYVVIAPAYMVYTVDYSKMIADHVESGADMTMMYHSVDNAKESFLNCYALNLNKQKGVLSLELNNGTVKNRNIFMGTCVLKKELFVDLVNKAHKTSSMYTLADIVNDECQNLDIRAVSHRGFFAAISDFKSYYDASLSLIDHQNATNLFNEDWPIYTRTNDSCPTQYFAGSKVTSSVVSNGCLIEGTIENSVIGRGCVIKEGAVVKNCVLSTDVVIGKNVHVENIVVDKHSRLVRGKRVIASPDKPGYVKRYDSL